MNFLFITKSFSSRYSVPLLSPHPCSAALYIKTASRFPVTGHASIPMPALMGIKCAAVRTMDRTADATIRAIILIRMPTGAGTVILELSILDIRCTCCLTMTASLESTFLYISVSWMQDVHDSVSGIVALKEFRDLNPDIPIQNLCFDSANDNYHTYNLCKTWNIRPFIDLNANRGMPKSIPGWNGYR